MAKRKKSPIARSLSSPEAKILGAASAVLAGGSIAAAEIARHRAPGRTADRQKQHYRLEPDETPKQGVSRVARGEIDLTVGLLKGGPDGHRGAEAVHEARKALKRLRALLRVSRPALTDARYQRENITLRDVGRELSDTRDAQVLVETLDSLSRRADGQVPDEAWSRLHEDLVARAERAQANGAGGYDSVLEILTRTRARVSRWPLPREDGQAVLVDGFERIYRRGRRALRRAERDATPENLHELRKRAKDLWHASQLLEPASPERMQRMAKKAHRLSDLLGDDHDLVVLDDYAHARPELLQPDAMALLDQAIQRRRRSLEAKALKRARRLYRRKPKRLLRRLSLVA